MRRFVLATAIASAAAFAQAAPADACGGPERPVCSILVPAPLVDRPRPEAGDGPQCIVTIGGLASPTDGSDNDFFAAVLGDLSHSLDHRVLRFGVDQGTYDTEGAISRSSAELRRAVRAIAGDCGGIHLLAHSMGGLVADRALAKIEPAEFGISTYVSMASPHNGAIMARVVPVAVAASPVIASVAYLADLAGAPDLGSDAVRDLARARRPMRVPRVKEHVRVRMLTDEIVRHVDNFDSRVDVREIAPALRAPREWLGHGGIVHSAEVQDLVRTTIGTGRVPPRAP